MFALLEMKEVSTAAAQGIEASPAGG